MTPEMRLIAVAVGVLWLSIIDISRRVERTNKLLEDIADELRFTNKDAREIERRENYPNLPY